MSSGRPEPGAAGELAARFERPGPVSFGLEEELMLLDPETLDLLPCGSRILEGLDARFKLELPASHVEIATGPHTDFAELEAELAACRRELAAHAGDRVRLAAGGVHPFAARSGEVSAGERYDRMLAEYGDLVRQQLVCGLHLHVSLGSADRTLAVYNAMRAFLPELAALAANAPVHCGRDTTLASIRPLISGLLPRQGVPPPLAGWEEYAEALGWGAASGRLGRPSEWWWELRPHAGLGTLEVRVPDAQTTVAAATAVGALALGVAVWLAGRHELGGMPTTVPTWRINENRWSALRRGCEGELVDLQTGERSPAGESIRRLIDRVAPAVESLGAGPALDRARDLLALNGARRQRAVFEDAGARGLAAWLASRFLDGT